MTDISHVSTKPWSDYSESDYTLDQWYNACLIRPPRSELTSKSQCKLPIRTPNGAVNRNGVFAAAAALAGARSEVKASSEEKAKAAKTLLRLYREMDQEPPDSLKRIGSLQMTDILEKPGTPQELVHYGVKGMKWGVRKDRRKNVDSMTYSQKQARIKKLHKELDKMDAEKGVAGAGLRGHYGKKVVKKDLKKNPNYDWRKESPEKRVEISRKVTRKAVRGTMLRHGAAVAAGLIASNQSKRISLSNQKDAELLKAGAKYAGLAFSANAAVTGVQSIRAIRQEGREYDIRVELTKLGDKERGR